MYRDADAPTCTNINEDLVRQTLEHAKEANIRNILALRVIHLMVKSGRLVIHDLNMPSILFDTFEINT